MIVDGQRITVEALCDRLKDYYVVVRVVGDLIYRTWCISETDTSLQEISNGEVNIMLDKPTTTKATSKQDSPSRIPNYGSYDLFVLVGHIFTTC